jgi:hypothetical protein
MRIRSLLRLALVNVIVVTVTFLGSALSFAPSAFASGPASLGVSGWQVNSNTSIYANSDPLQIHGDPGEYAVAPAIPAQGDSGWANCGPSSPLRFSPYAGTLPICPSASTIGMAVGSILPGCWSGLNFTYFQALVSIPANTIVSQFSVNMNGADDGARISLVNSLHPNGVTPSNGYIYQLTPQSTGNLASYVVAGEVNCTQSSTSAGEGAITLTSTCKDLAGNSASDTRTVHVDTTAPTDNPVVTPAPNGAGWNNSNVTVNWNWTDSRSGIDPNNCTQSSTSAGEGAITLTSTCKDLAGNSASDTRTVHVDTTAPVVTFAGNAATYSVDQSVSISCLASDALSGVASNTCTNVSAPAWSLGLGTHTLSATATDNAGNLGSGSTSFTVTVNATSLCALVHQFSINSGIANSLCVKLDAAASAATRGLVKTQANNLRAFINEVAAQSGKALTADQATLLTKYAATL